MSKDAKIFNRVAVTGLGIITAIGESVPEFKPALFNGQCGIRPVSLFDTSGFSCRNAAQVNTEDLFAVLERSSIHLHGHMQRYSRCDLLGLIAANEAILDSRLDLEAETCDRNRIGVITGGGAGGMLSWEKYYRDLWSGRKRPRPSLLLPVSQCAVTDLIAGQYGLTGVRSTVTTACSSSATSIGYGFDLIRTGTQNMVLVGGSEALSELTFSGFNALRQVDPEYCRPFDKNRKGLSLGEGAGMLVLENLGHARARGAHVYAELLGYAFNSDAYHMTSPHPQAIGMTKVMTHALERAGIRSNDVDYINTHGTGTRKNDLTETMAVKAVFGPSHSRKLSLSSTKSMVGHCLGASGAVEAISTVLTMAEQTAPPTIHLSTADEDCDLDYTPNRAQPKEINIAISNSFAFGGNNTCLVFGKPGP